MRHNSPSSDCCAGTAILVLKRRDNGCDAINREGVAARHRDPSGGDAQTRSHVFHVGVGSRVCQGSSKLLRRTNPASHERATREGVSSDNGLSSPLSFLERQHEKSNLPFGPSERPDLPWKARGHHRPRNQSSSVWISRNNHDCHQYLLSHVTLSLKFRIRRSSL